MKRHMKRSIYQTSSISCWM